MRKIAALFLHCVEIVRPFGLWKVGVVLAIAIGKALAQLVSVTAVLPFLTLAASRDSIETTVVGAALASAFPGATREELIAVAGGLMILALLAATVVSLLGDWARNLFVWRFADWTRLRMMDELRRRSLQWFASENSASTVKRLTTDVNQFANVIVGGAVDLVTRAALVLLLFVGMIAVNPIIALSTLLIVTLAFALIFTMLSDLRDRLSIRINTSMRGIFKEVSQFFGAIRIARIFNAEAYLQNRVGAASSEQARAQAILPLISLGPRYFLELMLVSALVVYILSLGATSTTLESQIPTLGFFALALFRIMPAAQMIYSTASTMTAMAFLVDEVRAGLGLDEGEALDEASANRPVTVTRPSVAPAPLELSNGIRLENLRFRYSGGSSDVFTGLDLDIRAGESIGLIGSSGAGKSTLVDLILGLQTPVTGAIIVDGTPLDTDARRRAWQRKIGYVPQDTFLIDDTITRNIAFGVADEKIDWDRLRKAAAQAQIAAFIDRELQERYATLVGERGVRLSGGQRQRIALARALYRRPAVLIFDEATSALDNETEEQILNTILSLPQSIIKIFVAHRLTSLRLCDKVYRVGDGVVVAVEHPADAA